MNTIFDHWRDERNMSSMEKLRAENARLVRKQRFHDAVAAVSWIIVGLIVLWQILGRYV